MKRFVVSLLSLAISCNSIGSDNASVQKVNKSTKVVRSVEHECFVRSAECKRFYSYLSYNRKKPRRVAPQRNAPVKLSVQKIDKSTQVIQSVEHECFVQSTEYKCFYSYLSCNRQKIKRVGPQRNVPVKLSV